MREYKRFDWRRFHAASYAKPRLHAFSPGETVSACAGVTLSETDWPEAGHDLAKCKHCEKKVRFWREAEMLDRAMTDDLPEGFTDPSEGRWRAVIDQFNGGRHDVKAWVSPEGVLLFTVVGTHEPLLSMPIEAMVEVIRRATQTRNRVEETWS